MPEPRPAVLYISYDGAAEALGRSQVVAYLERLADRHDITLVSFEKRGMERDGTARRLQRAGIRWRPLPYHRRPPVLSTAWDILRGARVVRREVRRRPPQVLHARSDVAALIALCAGRSGWRLVLDIRGFWADERVDLGLWRGGGPLHRLARHCERRFYREADAVVTLTHASVPQVRRWLGTRDVPVEVIPTCTDPARFGAAPPRPEGSRAVWCGSVGGWYRLDLGVRLAAALELPLTVLTAEVALARSVLGSARADVRRVAPDDIPAELRPGDVGLCLLRASFAKTASAPTRFAEYLAAGMPVAITPGIGDLDAVVAGERVGVVLRDETDTGLGEAARDLRRLAGDPQARERCRAVARDRFGLERGAHAYAALYARLARG